MHILDSLFVMQFICQVVGMTQLKLERKLHQLSRSRSLEIYSIWIVTFSLLALIYRLFFCDEDFYDTKNKNNHVNMKDHVIALIGIRVAHILSILEAISRRNEERKFFDLVHDIDRLFECSLHTRVDNRLFRRKILQHAAVMFVLYTSSELFIFSTLFCVSQLHVVFLSISYLLPFIACSIRYLQIFTAIAIIKSRLELLLSLISQFNPSTDTYINTNRRFDKATILRHFQKLSVIEVVISGVDMESSVPQKLIILLQLYDRLWELTCLLNSCVGFSMLINIGNDFLSIISNCYWVFLKMNETYSEPLKLIPIAVIWNIPHLCNLCVLCILCDRTMHNTVNIALSIHRMNINNFNDNCNTVIEQFSLQLLHQKITFTAAKFFNVDSTLLYTMISATTTYLVILIQFHLTNKNPK